MQAPTSSAGKAAPSGHLTASQRYSYAGVTQKKVGIARGVSEEKVEGQEQATQTSPPKTAAEGVFTLQEGNVESREMHQPSSASNSAIPSYAKAQAVISVKEAGGVKNPAQNQLNHEQFQLQQQQFMEQQQQFQQQYQQYQQQYQQQQQAYVLNPPMTLPSAAGRGHSSGRIYNSNSGVGIDDDRVDDSAGLSANHANPGASATRNGGTSSGVGISLGGGIGGALGMNANSTTSPLLVSQSLQNQHHYHQQQQHHYHQQQQHYQQQQLAAQQQMQFSPRLESQIVQVIQTPDSIASSHTASGRNGAGARLRGRGGASSIAVNSPVFFGGGGMIPEPLTLDSGVGVGGNGSGGGLPSSPESIASMGYPVQQGMEMGVFPGVYGSYEYGGGFGGGMNAETNSYQMGSSPSLYSGSQYSGSYSDYNANYNSYSTHPNQHPHQNHHQIQTHHNNPGHPIQTSHEKIGPEGANLFIFHIPGSMTNVQLFSLFTPFGNLLSVRIMTEYGTHRSRGFGFVSFDKPKSAAEAIIAMNGYPIGKKRLKVQLKTKFEDRVQVEGQLLGDQDESPEGGAAVVGPADSPGSESQLSSTVKNARSRSIDIEQRAEEIAKISEGEDDDVDKLVHDDGNNSGGVGGSGDVTDGSGGVGKKEKDGDIVLGSVEKDSVKGRVADQVEVSTEEETEQGLPNDIKDPERTEAPNTPATITEELDNMALKED